MQTLSVMKCLPNSSTSAYNLLWKSIYIFFKNYLFLCLLVSVHMIVHSVVAWHTQKAEEHTSNLRKLKLQGVMSNCVGAGNWTLVLCESSQCSSLLSRLSTSWTRIAIFTTFVDIGVGILCVSEREVVLEWKKKEYHVLPTY